MTRITETEYEDLLERAGVETEKDYVDTGDLLEIIANLQRKLETHTSAKIYAVVECYGLITYGVHLFRTSEEAHKWFKDYTSYDYDKFYESGDSLDEDYDQTKIFVIDLPEWLKILNEPTERPDTMDEQEADTS